MGKATGFIDYERTDNAEIPPLERIQHFNEFHRPLPKEKRQEQAGRCMDCGVPFCQNGQMLCGMISGCPLNNLIPEWNDLLYHGYEPQALTRLLVTNNFPEFTSRVCPALCEKACTCGLYGDPVTVRDNEYALIEYGYA
ncbi:MAG: glutamate synthase, partial [Oscillospiraceae bacterium]|nr:glutamate synthase [Oscillospiraceae bacterium]